MPLSLKGRKIKRAMETQYGKKKGTKVFYAWENKHRRITRRRKGK